MRGGQLGQRDIRILADQFLKERLMWRELTLTTWPALRRYLGASLCPNRARSAAGNGADMFEPPEKEEPQFKPAGNPPNQVSGVML